MVSVLALCHGAFDILSVGFFLGEVYAESTETSMNTMCTDITNAHNWPMDEVTCDIQLGVIFESITLIPAEDNFFKV